MGLLVVVIGCFFLNVKKKKRLYNFPYNELFMIIYY